MPRTHTMHICMQAIARHFVPAETIRSAGIPFEGHHYMGEKPLTVCQNVIQASRRALQEFLIDFQLSQCLLSSTWQACQQGNCFGALTREPILILFVAVIIHPISEVAARENARMELSIGGDKNKPQVSTWEEEELCFGRFVHKVGLVNGTFIWQRLC